MRIFVFTALGCLLAAISGCQCSSCSAPQMPPLGDSMSLGCSAGMCRGEPACGVPTTGFGSCGCADGSCAGGNCLGGGCQQKPGGCLDTDLLWSNACSSGCGAVCQYGSTGRNCPCASCQGGGSIRPGFVPSCGPTCDGSCHGGGLPRAGCGGSGCGCGAGVCATAGGCGGTAVAQAATGLLAKPNKGKITYQACGGTCDGQCGGSCPMAGGGLGGVAQQARQRVAQRVTSHPKVAHAVEKIAYTCENGHCGGRPGPMQGAVMYPYYTVRGPRDFFHAHPPSIGP